MEKARKTEGIYRKNLTAGSFATRVILTILLLQVLFPNLVHEPLHYIAFASLGIPAEIVFDWSLPATPVVNFPIAQIDSVAALFFTFMLPSLVTFAFIVLLGSIRTRFPAFKIGAIAYLAFDLITNIRGFQAPTSDFRLLLLTNHPNLLAICLIIIIIAFALWGIFGGLKRIKIVKVIKNKIIVRV